MPRAFHQSVMCNVRFQRRVSCENAPLQPCKRNVAGLSRFASTYQGVVCTWKSKWPAITDLVMIGKSQLPGLRSLCMSTYFFSSVSPRERFTHAFARMVSSQPGSDLVQDVESFATSKLKEYWIDACYDRICIVVQNGD